MLRYIIIPGAGFRPINIDIRITYGGGMGFFKRLLGLETRPGEPETLRDELFGETVSDPDLPLFVFFFNLWCSGCQVMHGLLNEVAPEYIGRARFYKMDAGKSPRTVSELGIRGVPLLVSYTPDGEPESISGLLNITELRSWLDGRIAGGDGTAAAAPAKTDVDEGAEE
jgi:thioredoxin 1